MSNRDVKIVQFEYTNKNINLIEVQYYDMTTSK